MTANQILLALLALSSSAAAAASPTYEDVVGLIHTQNIQSLDGLLAALPSAYKQYYSLLFDSDSLQYADPLNPRAIVFGEDATLVMAFSCAAGDCTARSGLKLDLATLAASRDLASFDSLELMQFRADTRRFELFEIRFTGQGVQTSGPNPPQCLSCHGQDPRPNWEHYDVWPKAYGDNKDGTVVYPGRDSDLATYKASSAQRQRYRQLPGFASDDSAAGGPVVNQPNSTLSERFQSLNYRRIVRQMATTPDGSDMTMVILGAAAGCNMPDFFPAGVEVEVFQKYAADLRVYAADPKIEHYATSTEFGFLSSYNDFLVTLMAMFDLKGMATAAWPMAHPAGFYSSFVTPLNPTGLFLGALLESRPELSTYLDLASPRLPGLMEASLKSTYDCAKLASLSTAAITSTRQGTSPFFVRDHPSWEALASVAPSDTFVQCQQCHTAAGAPYLPFDQPLQFTQQQLDQIGTLISATPGAGAVRRMPPGGPYLDDAAQTVFLGYLNFRRRPSQNPEPTP